MTVAEKKEIVNVGSFEHTIQGMVGLGNINKVMTAAQMTCADKDFEKVADRWAKKHCVTIRSKCWKHCVMD